MSDIQPQLEKLISKNYFLNISAKEAFKSYVRSYESHGLKQIFNVQTLDLAKVGKSLDFNALEKDTIMNENKIIFFSTSFHPFFFYIHLEVLYLF